MVSTDANWWAGTNKVLSLANRGGAIGNLIPANPWVEGWQQHTSVGVDTTAGGTSNVINLSWTLSDNGATYDAVGTITHSGGS